MRFKRTTLLNGICGLRQRAESACVHSSNPSQLLANNPFRVLNLKIYGQFAERHGIDEYSDEPIKVYVELDRTGHLVGNESKKEIQEYIQDIEYYLGMRKKCLRITHDKEEATVSKGQWLVVNGKMN